MASTIQVEKDTMELLKNLKNTYNTKTYDELINQLVRKKVSGSMFAKLSKGKTYTMKNILKGLRDESDRL
ncbi:MAG: hypothetical protein V1672_05105 [Candidatus Diapherotrites archaeon]